MIITGDIYWCLILTGARIGEILALTTECVDLELNVLHIETSLTKDENDKTIIGKDTKTKSGIRDIPLTETLKDILIPRMKKPKDLLFTQPNGKLISTSTINSHFKKICKNAGIRVTYVDKRKSNGAIVKLKTSTATVHRTSSFCCNCFFGRGSTN